MTTNKPEAVAYRYTASRSFGKRNPKWHYQESFPHAENRKVEEIGQLEKLIRLSDYEALQAELADMERDYLVIIEAQDAEHRKQLARLQMECEKLRAAIRRLCNIYVVDDYYMGEDRNERLDHAVNRAIDAALQEPAQ